MAFTAKSVPPTMKPPKQKGQGNPAHRKRLKREADLALECEMYVRGETLYAISKKIGVSRAQIHRDLATLRQQWYDRMSRALDQHRSEELKKLDYLEAEAYRAWEESKKNAETIETTKRVADAVKSANSTGSKKGQPAKRKSEVTTIKSQGQYGDPRFLAIVERCIAKRCEILGVTALSGQEAQDNFKVQEDVRSIIEQRIKQLGTSQTAPPPSGGSGNGNGGGSEPPPIDITAQTVQ